MGIQVNTAEDQVRLLSRLFDYLSDGYREKPRSRELGAIPLHWRSFKPMDLSGGQHRRMLSKYA
jgi:hypothetical protein